MCLKKQAFQESKAKAIAKRAQNSGSELPTPSWARSAYANAWSCFTVISWWVLKSSRFDHKNTIISLNLTCLSEKAEDGHPWGHRPGNGKFKRSEALVVIKVIDFAETLKVIGKSKYFRWLKSCKNDKHNNARGWLLHPKWAKYKVKI